MSNTSSTTDIVNLALSVYWQAFGEALILCKLLGIDPTRLIEIFSETSGSTNMLKVRGADAVMTTVSFVEGAM